MAAVEFFCWIDNRTTKVVVSTANAVQLSCNEYVTMEHHLRRESLYRL
jgi:hypothetical protein